ncbi:MAG: hypothetical protein NTY41_13315 [Proteobacteria bacterium]|nr:hypothetical protein [Pseudomonadota bacterium]
MKIAAASLAFSSQHSATFRSEKSETLRTWIGPNRPDFEGGATAQPAPAISAVAYSAQAQDQSLPSSGSQAINDAIEIANHDPILQLIRSMLELLTGHSIQIFTFQARPGQTPPAPAPVDPKPAALAGQARAGFGIEYERHEIRTETEQTDFQAAGTIRTTDGKEIQFQLDLSMQRRYSQESDLSLRAGDARQKDPLVINFGGTAAQLQNRRFLFDIAGNGQAEKVPLLGAGSGFLALDLNGNGRIDTGKELFGTASGNGFADLAGHDRDGNGWIDENDPVFGELRVWTPDGSVAGTLASLQQKNVGALFLGSQTTPFELRNSNNQSLGSVRASGVYLAENGIAGTLQQIDLSV